MATTEPGAGAHGPSIGEATDALRGAARTARSAADRARREFADALAAAQEGLQEAQRFLRASTLRRPVATLAAAAGAGVVLGLLLGQRR